jgi:predicted DNA-binding protein (UPF0251 family)
MLHMSGRESAETKEAMRRVDAGSSVRGAAKACGIERSTLIRALARRVLKLSQANAEAVEGKLPEESSDV